VEHQSPGRGAEVEVVLEGNKRDAKGFQVSDGIHQMFQRPSKPIELPAADRIKFPLVRVCHQTVQRRPAILGPADAVVNVLPADLKPSSGAVLPHLA
jgi:hypothetical protein